MNDLVILGIVLGSVLGSIALLIFIIQEREAKTRALELKMFQTENTRHIQENSKFLKSMEMFMQTIEKNAELRHEENMTFFRGLGYSVGRIVHKLDSGDGKK